MPCMKKLLVFLVLIATVSLSACSGNSTEDPNKCEDVSAADFITFLGVKYGMVETKLDEVLGQSSGGEYVSDSSQFIFYFNWVDRVPLSIWTNGENTLVQTIFIEILSYEEKFENDKQAVIDKFDLDPCDLRFMGMTADEIIAIMGDPDEKRDLEEGVSQISYDTKDYSCNVCFKFYESQGNICSSIRVTWFY